MTRRTLIETIGGDKVYQDRPSGVISWTSRQVTVNADGSPHAYGPSGKGLDYLSNAGHPGNWWGVLADDNGRLLVQKINDPAPGFYISTTSLQDRTKKQTDPRRYADSETIPHIALPPVMFNYCRLGDLGICYMSDYWSYFIVADTGGKGHIGEVSIFIAKALRFPNPSPKNGGSDQPVRFVLYPNSGTGQLLTAGEIGSRAKAVVDARGIEPLHLFSFGRKLRIVT
jgi:hypothetical protein